MIPAVEFRGVTRRFGQTVANSDISFSISQGSIHGIIGENGAGKSTLVKMLYGMLRPDSGEILIRGEQCQLRSPGDAITKGVGMVHQHFMLAGLATVLDNILLGAEPIRWGILNRKAALEDLAKATKEYGLAVDWHAAVDTLSVGAQQRVEILKLLYRKADILILDEPTAVLTPSETLAFFHTLARMRDAGKTVLLVTHKLKEILAITDHVSVLRAGKLIGSFATKATSADELAWNMVGRKMDLLGTVPSRRPRPELALELGRINLLARRGPRHARLHDISFAIHRGEIVAVAGVEGNGQRELVGLLADPLRGRGEMTGSIKLSGEEATRFNAARVRGSGVAFIPEDRLREAIVPESPLYENFLLGRQYDPEFRRGGLVRWPKVQDASQRALDLFDIRPRDATAVAGALSGGNQQKLVLARELSRRPTLLIASQPTRGVDIGAVDFIHRQILNARDHGAGVLLLCSDLDEILTLADRILVMFGGRIVAEYERGRATEQELGLKMGGG